MSRSRPEEDERFNMLVSNKTVSVCARREHFKYSLLLLLLLVLTRKYVESLSDIFHLFADALGFVKESFLGGKNSSKLDCKKQDILKKAHLFGRDESYV